MQNENFTFVGKFLKDFFFFEICKKKMSTLKEKRSKIKEDKKEFFNKTGAPEDK